MSTFQQVASAVKSAMIFILAIMCTYFYTGHHLPFPTPGVVPAPIPVPVAKLSGTMHVTMVFDPASISPEIGAIRSSVTIAPALKALDGVWRNYEITDPALSIAGLKDPATTAGLPALLVQDKDGRIIRAIRSPSTEAAVIDQANLIRGGK